MDTLLRLWRTLDGIPWREALLAEWQECLGDDFPLVQEHLSPTGELATTYPCQSGAGDGCPRQVHERGGGVFEAVCGNLPAECAPLRLRKIELAVLRLDEVAALGAQAERVRLWECLEPAGVEAYAGILPIGRIVRRAGSALVVLATPEQAKARGAVLELQRRAGTDRAVVLVAGRWEDQCSPEGVVELAMTEPGHPRLHRAAKLLWPEVWAGRAKASTTERYAHLTGTLVQRAAAEHDERIAQKRPAGQRSSSHPRDLNPRPAVYETAHCVPPAADFGAHWALLDATRRAVAEGLPVAGDLARVLATSVIGQGGRTTELAVAVLSGGPHAVSRALDLADHLEAELAGGSTARTAVG